MRTLTQALTLTSLATSVRGAFNIASVAPVLWWDAESHRASLAGTAGAIATAFQDSAGTSAVTAVEQPVGRLIDLSTGGRHALQATSTARPLLSARKNLLTYTEVFDNAAWLRSGFAVESNVEIAPDGTQTADRCTITSGGYSYMSYFLPSRTIGMTVTWSSYVKTATRSITFGGATPSGPDVFTSTSVGGGWWRQTLTRTFTSSGTNANVQTMYGAGLPASGVVVLWGAQLEFGPSATSYQRVAAASDYSTSEPLFMQFDGVDDSISTAALAAGSLPANADVYVVLRRSAGDGNTVIASPFAGSAPQLAALNSGSSSLASVSSGAPTYSVNGAVVPGGTGTTRAQLAAALPETQRAVLEVRNADLSAWTSFAMGAYGSGLSYTGNINAVLICPAQSDSTRAKIRKALAKAYQIQGVI
jgi:hypothetical protein